MFLSIENNNISEQKKERENAESQLRAQLEEISEERDKLRTKLEEDRNQQAQHIEVSLLLTYVYLCTKY